MIRIEGVAYLPEPGEQSDTWSVPNEPVPLTVEFGEQIGVAALMRDADGTVHCKAHVTSPDAERVLTDYPKFAVSVRLRDTNGGRTLDGAHVSGVCVCHENDNHDVPSYSVTQDAAE